VRAGFGDHDPHTVAVRAAVAKGGEETRCRRRRDVRGNPDHACDAAHELSLSQPKMALRVLKWLMLFESNAPFLNEFLEFNKQHKGAPVRAL
jgi:hypothetical protein